MTVQNRMSYYLIIMFLIALPVLSYAKMYSDHPRLFMRPQKMTEFRQNCKTGYAQDVYKDLKTYVDQCMKNGWGSGWTNMNLMCITVVALVENTEPYINEAHVRAKEFIKSMPDCANAGQIFGLAIASLAMYYDLLWESNSSMRQAVADKLHDCFLIEGTGSKDSHYGNHYFDSIERSTWFALTCRGDGYYDQDAEKAYQIFLDRWVRDGSLKSIIKQVGGTNGGIYEGSYYFVQNWLTCLSVMLAAYETSHDDVPADFVKENYSMIYYAPIILTHAKRPWDRALDQSGDMYATWHIAGWMGKAICQKWGGSIAHHLMTQVGNSIDPDAQWGNPSSNTYRNGPRSLYVLYHQNVSNPNWNDVPLAYNCTAENGIVSYMRSSWNDATATWASFEATDEIGGHKGATQGHFQIGKHAILASKSGSYCLFEDKHHYEYSFRTYAANCVTVYRSDEVFKNGPYNLHNDGGQNFAGTFWADKFTTSIPDLSKDIRFKNEADFTYSSADITNAYSLNPQKKLSSYTRQFIYFRPDFFFVIDRIDALSGQYEKKWIIHTPNEPAISGLSASADNGKGRLYIKTILPKDASMKKIGGESTGFYYDAYSKTNYLPTCEKEESRTWRTEVVASLGNNSDIFLHALQATSTSNNQPVQCVEVTNIQDGFKGGHFKTSSDPRVVIFSSTSKRNRTVEFTPQQSDWTGLAGILVTDLDAGTYSVQKDSNILSQYSSVSVDSNGVLYFKDNSFGHYQIRWIGEYRPAPVKRKNTKKELGSVEFKTQRFKNVNAISVKIPQSFNYDNLKFQLFDMTGRRILTTKKGSLTGDNHEILFVLSGNKNLNANGTYIARCTLSPTKTVSAFVQLRN